MIHRVYLWIIIQISRSGRLLAKQWWYEHLPWFYCNRIGGHSTVRMSINSNFVFFSLILEKLDTIWLSGKHCLLNRALMSRRLLALLATKILQYLQFRFSLSNFSRTSWSELQTLKSVKRSRKKDFSIRISNLEGKWFRLNHLVKSEINRETVVVC